MALDEIGIRYIVDGISEATSQLNSVADSEERAAEGAQKLSKPTQDAGNAQRQLAAETNTAKTALSGLTQVAGRAGVDLGTFGNITNKAFDALQNLATGGAGVETALLGLGTAVGLAGAAAVNLAVEWESSLTKISNDANLTDEQARAVGDGLRQMSGDFVFSATEMASAIAGVGGKWQLYTGETLDAKGATDLVRVSAKLAQADGAGLEGTMRALTNVMAAYKLPVEEASRVTDILNNTGDATGASVQSLASGLDRLQARLGTLAPPIEETATLVAQLSANGLEGNRAMMIVVSALNSLESGSEEVNAKLSELGVTVFDETGNFVGLRSVIEQLSPAIEGMTDKQAKATLATLFGSGAAGVMSGVLAGGVATWDRYAEAIGKTGTTEEEYARSQETVAVQLKEFKIQVEEVARTIGENLIGKLTTAAETIEPITSKVKDMIDAWGNLPGPLRDAIGNTALLFGGLMALHAVMTVVTGALGLVTGALGLKTAAQVADTVATEANTLATGANAVAMQGQAVAATGVATSSTAAGVGIGSMLGPIGFAITAGVGLAVVFKGIVDSFFGAESHADQVKDRVNELGKEFSGLDITAQRLNNRFYYLTADAAKFTAAAATVGTALQQDQHDTEGLTGSIYEASKMLEQGKIDAEAYGVMLRLTGTSTSELIRIHNGLPPELQEAFEKGVNWESIVHKMGESAAVSGRDTNALAEAIANSGNAAVTNAPRILALADAYAQLARESYDSVIRSDALRATAEEAAKNGTTLTPEQIATIYGPEGPAAFANAKVAEERRKASEAAGRGGGGGGASVEAKSVAAGFADEIAAELTTSVNTDKFGSAGATLLDALTAAMAKGATSSQGEALARAVDSLVDDAKERGVPSASELGSQLIAAIGIAIETHTPEAIAAVETLVAQLGEAAATISSLTVESLDTALTELDKIQAREEDIGSAGVSFMDTFTKAISKGGKDAVESVAKSADNIVDSLRSKLEPAQAEYVAGAFMDALKRAITEKSPESLAALEDWFRKIKVIEDGGVVDITTGMIYTADQIKAIADKIGLGVSDVVKNFSTLVSSGILGMADAIATAPGVIQGVIQKILSDLDAGIIDAATAVASLKSVLNGGSGVVQPPETTGGGGGAYNPGTGALPGEDVQTFATRILGFNPYTSTTQYLTDLNGFRLTADDITSTVLHAGAAGLRALRVVTTALYDPNNPSPQAPPPSMPRQAITPMALGSPWVPDGLVARLHQGERVLSPSANSFFSSLFGFGEWGPRSVLASLSRMAGASGQTSSLTVDMRHSTFSGSPEENAAAFEEAAQRVIDRNWGRNALLSGVR